MSTDGSARIGVFFDVDGTLADSYCLGLDSTNEVLRRHGGKDVSEESYHEGTKYTTPRRLAWHVTGDPDDPIGQPLSEEFDRLYVDLVSTTTASLYPGISDLLFSVQGQHAQVVYAALSNACTAYVEAVLRVNGLDTIFPVALGPDKVTAAKPAPDGLWQISRTLDIPVNRCAFIGDSPTDGIAARSAGMHSIGVTWGSHPAEKVEAAFDETVHTVDDLRNRILHFVEKISSQ